MASPAPLTVYVEKTALPGAKASQYLTPIETNRRGEVTGITLTVPIFSERNAFLVVKLSGQVATELVRAVSEKPEGQREQFIREWIKQNQLAIYDQYVKSGGKSKRFQYNVVPVTGLNLAEVTPRRAEPQKPAVASATPRKVEEQKAPPAPEQKRRGLVVEDEKPKKPAEAKKPEPVEELAPLVPLVPKGPKPAQKEPEMQEFEGGTGSKADPFRINILTNRSKKEIQGVPYIEFPIHLLGYNFIVTFTLNQIAKSRIEATYEEIFRLTRDTVIRAEPGTKVTATRNFENFRAALYKAVADKPQIKQYLDTH